MIAAGGDVDFDSTNATRSLLNDGFVVLKAAVDVKHIDKLRGRMLVDLEKIKAMKTLPENFVKGHLQQDPPPDVELLFDDLLANPRVVQVLKPILGDGMKLCVYTGNTNLPGTAAQPVHPDFYQLWPRLSMAHPGYGYIINVPLVDTSAHNGSIELWPGTHTDTAQGMAGGNLRIDEADMQRWRDKRPPLQPTMMKGDILVRDCRLWHRGMPNNSTEPRPMIGMIVWAGWYASGEHLVMPAESEPFFRSLPIAVEVKYTKDPIDHIGRLQAFDVRSDGNSSMGTASTNR
jgi:hypothetical protein